MRLVLALMGVFVLVGGGGVASAQTPIADIQQYNPTTGAPASPYAGTAVTVTGSVYVPKNTYNSGTFYIQDATGGIGFFDSAAGPFALGDVIELSGTVGAFSGEIQILTPSAVFLNSGPVVTANTIDISALTYEDVGTLVEVIGTIAATNINGGNDDFKITNGTDTLLIFVDVDTGCDLSAIAIGDLYSASGPLVNMNGLLEIKPRFNADLVSLAGATQITPIGDIQYYDPISGIPMSPYENQVVTCEGVVYAVKGTLTSGGYYVQDETGGINYFAPYAQGIAIGDTVRVTAPVYYFEGEIYLHDSDPIPDFEILANGPEPDPHEFTVGVLIADFENVGWFGRVEGAISGLVGDGIVLNDGGESVSVHVSELAGIDLTHVQADRQIVVQGACVVRNGMIQLWPRYQTDLNGGHDPLVFYVATTGSDLSGDGSQGNPYGTIQHAIDLSADGDEVQVLPGIYTGNGNRDISFLGKAITVKSRDEDPTTCIIDCQGSEVEPHRGFIFGNDEGPESVLIGLSVTGGFADSDGGGGILLAGNDPWEQSNGSSPTIQHCEIAGNAGAGIQVRGSRANPDVYDCNIYGNQGDGVRVNYAQGRFTNCEFKLNAGSGYDGRGSGWSGEVTHFEECEIADNVGNGLYIGYGVVAEVRNCVIDNNDGVGVLLQDDSGWFLVEGSDISNNAGDGIESSDPFARFEAARCRVFGNGGHGITLGTAFATNSVVRDSEIYGNGGWGVSLTYDWQHQSVKVTSRVSAKIDNCRISLNQVGGIGGRFDAGISGATLLVTDSLIFDNRGDGIALSAETRYRPNITLTVGGTTIVNNDGRGIYTEAESLTLQNTLLADNGLAAVELQTISSLAVSCTDIFANAGGDWTGTLAPLLGQDGNLSLDPKFCRADNAGDPYTLNHDSPCAAETNLACGQIGARAVGCNDSPIIGSITDVGNDQGRQVRLTWLRSGYDRPATAHTILGYGIYREQGVAKSAVSVTRGGDKLFGWDYLATVPARQDSIYQFVAPTLCDSTISAGPCLTSFMISAMTADPGTYFDSRPDSGYSVDNLSPAAPGNLSVIYAGGENLVTWDPSSDDDFSHFVVYRALISADLSTETADSLGTAIAAEWRDMIGSSDNGRGYRYLIVATDLSGNRSLRTLQVSAVPDLPTRTALHCAVPNPFNPMTMIGYNLPQPATVNLRIYDMAGRLVRTLVRGDVVDAGRKEVIWRGRDDSGRQVAAGVYFYKLDAGSFSETKRMTLVK